LVFFANIKAFLIFFTINGVFKVVYINIDTEYDKREEIGQKDVPESCPKGEFKGEDIRQLHIYLLVENIYGN
jgi:hypothetical protein